MALQEAEQLLTRLTRHPYCRLTRLHQIADRLMCLVGNPIRRQFTSPMQLGRLATSPRSVLI
jgi:hypothetical protein